MIMPEEILETTAPEGLLEEAKEVIEGIVGLPELTEQVTALCDKVQANANMFIYIWIAIGILAIGLAWVIIKKK